MDIVTGDGRKMKKTLYVFIGSLVFITALWGCSGNRTDYYNMESPRYLDCPDTPNCVSSLAKNPKYRVEPFRLKKEPKSSWDIVKETVGSLPRTKIVSANSNDIQAECTSMIFRFTDDLLLHLTPADGIIHIRSSSRTGYLDLGVNRDRIESLRKKLQEKDIIE
jgi:uncharacterized protein (DUF1499 family)